jgi:hypothetical protein
LPSDIQTLLRGIYFSFFPQKGQPNYGTFSIDVWKQSRGAGTDRIPNTVPLLNSYSESALYTVDAKTTLLLPTLTISYNVAPDYRLVSYDPSPAYQQLTGGNVAYDPNINYDVLAKIVGVLTIVIDFAVSLLTPVPEISITKLLASIPRTISAVGKIIKLTLSNLPKGEKAVAFIAERGGTIIKLAVRSLSIIGRGVKIIFSGTVRLAVQLAKFVRRFVRLPRGLKPKEKPRVPPVKNADDAIRLPIRDQPSLITRIRKFLTYARSGARGAKIPEKPIEIKKAPVESPPKVTESMIDRVIARGGKLGRMTKSARKAFMRQVGRVRKAIKAIKKLKSKLVKKLEALGKKVKSLKKFLKKLAKKLLRKILKKLRKSRLSRYRQKLFRRLFFYLLRKFGRLLVTGVTVMVNGVLKFFGILGSIASAGSFIARVIRVTIENTGEEEEDEDDEDEDELE